jgi:hypothetical protein
MKKRYYEVVIELTGSSKRFDCIEEAFEYAEWLADETGYEVLVVERDPAASRMLDGYIPIGLFEGSSSKYKPLR